jgi:chromate reductase
MADTIRVLAVAGSMRAGSYNKLLLKLGADRLSSLGAEVDVLDLRDVVMPLYDGDLEAAQGLPPGAVAFKQRLARAQGLLISCPEYNASIPGTFKNAIDWATRGEEDVFTNKVAALMAASPGGFGGVRCLPHLRQVLTDVGVWLVPAQVTVSKAHEAFRVDGTLVSELFQSQVDGLAAALLAALRLRT